MRNSKRLDSWPGAQVLPQASWLYRPTTDEKWESAQAGLVLDLGDLARKMSHPGAGKATEAAKFSTAPAPSEAKTTFPSSLRGAHSPCHAACASTDGPLGALRRPLCRPVDVSAALGQLASCLSDEAIWRRRRRLLGLGPAEGDGRRQQWRLGADGAAGRGPLTFCCSCGRAS